LELLLGAGHGEASARRPKQARWSSRPWKKKGGERHREEHDSLLLLPWKDCCVREKKTRRREGGGKGKVKGVSEKLPSEHPYL
jgi:hypothetical protein